MIRVTIEVEDIYSRDYRVELSDPTITSATTLERQAEDVQILADRAVSKITAAMRA